VITYMGVNYQSDRRAKHMGHLGVELPRGIKVMVVGGEPPEKAKSSITDEIGRVM
jgi:hypothetical protein